MCLNHWLGIKFGGSKLSHFNDFGVIVLIISFIGFRGYAVRKFKQASIDARKFVRFPEEDQQVAEGK